MSQTQEFDVVVIGAGPAGTAAALSAAECGAKTALVTKGAFGGMSANDGPIPVRTLAHAARLAREARQLPRYGISVGEPSIDYTRLIARATEVVGEGREHSTLLTQTREAGVDLYEQAGTARFLNSNAIGCETGPALRGKCFVIATGGVSRQLTVPGAELTVTPAAAFGLTELPKSLLVIGAGATGMQVASIFNAFGTKIVLCQAGPRIVPTEDAAVSDEMARCYREDGVDVIENCGPIQRFEPCAAGVRTVFQDSAVETQFAVCCVGWVADAASLSIAEAGVRTDMRGFIEVDEFLRTSVPHIFAAGDVIGRAMLVPQAVIEGYRAGKNAAGDQLQAVRDEVEPIGSFTDPEYAKVGPTEAEARVNHNVTTSLATYQETTRPVIDGRTRGFCKLVVDAVTLRILGCHTVGERAVEVAQMAAIAMTANMTVEDVARIPLSFPTYANVLGRAAIRASLSRTARTPQVTAG